MARILIVDDEAAVREALAIGLTEAGHQVEAVGTAGEAMRRAAAGFEAILLDLRLPDRHGLEVLASLRERGDETPVIVISADTEMSSTVTAMRDGAFDYVSKPLDLDALESLIGRAVERAARSEPALGATRATSALAHELVGNSSALREVFKTLGLLAASRATVLIRGESGTGKELAAQALHRFSRAAAQPFVAVHCAALPATLIEAEIFGHKRGAFTSADADRAGKLEVAGDGTLFLDEVGDVPLEAQVKLLRVLQERTFERLGETVSRPFRARVVAATHRDLEALVREGRFREDLYFRLNVATVTLPPLRERREDIAPIAERLLGEIAHEVERPLKGLAQDAVDLLGQHDWPGNVRELRNVLTRAAVRCRSLTITAEDIVLASATPAPPGTALGAARPGRGAAAPALEASATFPSLDEVEREHIRRALLEAQGHKGKACQLLGISRPTLARKIVRYSLGKP